MSMGCLIKIDGSPFWQARFPGKSGVEVQHSTKARDRKQAEAILADWALQAHLERQPGLCQIGLAPTTVRPGVREGRTDAGRNFTTALVRAERGLGGGESIRAPSTAHSETFSRLSASMIQEA